MPELFFLFVCFSFRFYKTFKKFFGLHILLADGNKADVVSTAHIAVPELQKIKNKNKRNQLNVTTFKGEFVLY